MKTRKRILATLLSVAVAATTVLPGGALTTNAATIVTRESATDVENSETWSETMDKENIGGTPYWHLQSSATNNNNNNSDYSLATAPAIILDKDRDMTFKGEPSTVSVDIYPNGTLSTMRFGIMLKYVNPTNWAYLYYDGGWGFEYNCSTGTSYAAISGIPALVDNQDRTVEITYTSDSVIEISVLNNGESESEPYELTNEALKTLEDFAATAGVDEEGNATNGPAPIRFGFKAGTFSGTITDVNLKNMTLDDEDMANDNWDWVVSREGQVFDPYDVVGGTNYVTLNGKTSSYTALEDFENGDVFAVFRPVTDSPKFALLSKYTENGAVEVGYDGSWYYKVGAAKQSVNANLAVTKDADYEIAITADRGKLTATAMSAEEGATPVTIAENVNIPSNIAAGTIALKAEAGTEVWVRNVDYEKRTYSDTTELSARYNEVAQAANLSGNNADNKYFTAAWATFKNAADDAKAKIDADEITSDEATSALNTLNSEYTKLQNNEVQKSKPFTDLVAELEKVKDIAQITPEGTYSQATWDEFVAKKAAAQKIVDEIATTPYENSAAITRTNALRDLKAATNALALLANDSEKAALQAALAAANALNASHYEEDGWNDFVLARDDAAAVFANIANATKDDITDVLAALTRAQEDLVLKAASADEVAASTNEIAAIESAVNGKFTVDAAYTQALQTVKDLLKKENVTKKEIDEAMAALNAAKAALKPVETQVQTPPAATLTKGQTQKVGKMTYKVLDPAKKTVSLTKGQDKKNVTVPDTVKIGSETCKVVTIGKNAFKGSKKLTSVIIGKNVTKIEGSAFANSKKLKQVTFKGTSVKTIAGKAFTKIASKVTVKVPKKLKKDSKFKNKLKKAGMKQITIK